MSDAYRHVVVVGGAGFIGSHLVRTLLDRPDVERVTVYDNFTSGRRWHLEAVADDPRLDGRRGRGPTTSTRSPRRMAGATAVVHLASNPDIAKAMTDPTIDFDEGTLLTHCVVEAARRGRRRARPLRVGQRRLRRPRRPIEADEDHGPLEPVSTYGASKLAGEALIASYCHMFGLRGRAFRFGNVVGPEPDPRRRLRLRPQAARRPDPPRDPGRRHAEQVLRPRRRRARGRAARRRDRRRAVRRLQRRHRRLHHRARRSPSSPSSASGSTPTSVEAASTAAATAAGRATFRSYGSRPTRIRALGWTNRYDTRAALRASMRVDARRRARRSAVT